jgi:hypothetical protein
MGQPTKEEMLDALYDKYQTLYDFLQELNGRVQPEDRPDYEGIILNAQLEIQRVREAYDFVEKDHPIPYPSDDQVRALAGATGELQRIVGINTQLEALIGAATALIKTWPVSGAG